jgi:serine/threonine protein kinase
LDTPPIGDRYELIEVLGEGGFAVTHRAWDMRLERPVAIKLLRPHFAGDHLFVQRFVREARAAASVSHPNVVRLYDFGDRNGEVFIAMQYVLGETLRDLLRRSRRGLPVGQALDLFRRILGGLGAVHAAGIVHRDIKPENVLLDREGNPLITDFGIALLGDQLRLTTAETAFGTAAYMAPEQARGEAVGPATDLYSAGVVLFELLTGRLPFEGETAVAMMLAHQEQTPAAPSRFVPEKSVPIQVDSAVLRSLAKFPSARFQSTAQFQAALDAHVKQAPVADPRLATLPMPQVDRREPGPVRPRPRQVPRPRSKAWLLMLIALLLLTAIGAVYASGYLDDDPLSGPLPEVPTATTQLDDEPTIEVAPTEEVIEELPEPTPTDTFVTEPPLIVSEVPDEVTIESISSPQP